MGLVARYLESRGISTVSLSNLAAASERVKPPRALLVPGPRGQTAGKPHDRAEQRRRVEAALDLLEHAQTGGVLKTLNPAP